jgi:hypothetical protein
VEQFQIFMTKSGTVPHYSYQNKKRIDYRLNIISGIYTGSGTVLSKQAMQQAIEDPDVNLSFDNLIRLCIMNHNRGVVPA